MEAATEPINVPARPLPATAHSVNRAMGAMHRQEWMPMRDAFAWLRPSTGRRRA